MTDTKNYWDLFPKTDPKYTKSKKSGGRTITSVAPVYMVKLISDVFGGIGQGWGYKVLEERFDNTTPVKVAGEFMLDGGNIVWEQVHTLHLEMWVGSEENTFSQYGHTKYRYMKTDGSRLVVDEEYAKKSMTDAMTKCFSLVGVCSDVYMGEFDDINYQEAARIESDIAKADDKTEAIKKKTAELNQHIQQNIHLMDSCPNFDAVGKVYGLAHSKASLLGKSLGMDEQAALAPLDQKYFELKQKFEAVQ